MAPHAPLPPLAIAALLLSALAGCNEMAVETLPPAVEVKQAGEVDDAGVRTYPAGPYGIAKGSTIARFRFQGFVDPSVGGPLEPIDLGDFYNPTGDGTFPEGSPYGGGTPKPKVLAIVVSAVWCGPCKAEAKEVLPVKYAALSPRGCEFLLDLADGPTPGTPAEEKHLRAWTQTFKVTYPSVIDPDYQLGALFKSDAFPANIIVDTTTMEIVEVILGAPNEDYWTKLETLLDPPTP